MNTVAMILAAGRGERMRPLTDRHPKPLLHLGGIPLMEWTLRNLARDGVTQVVINTAWLGEQIPQTWGSVYAGPTNPPVPLTYSREDLDFGKALETAGGISRALPLLGNVFWLAAGDVFAPDFVFDPLAVQAFERSNALAHLWLVPNPEHNLKGDFGWIDTTRLHHDLPEGIPRYTYSTIGLYRRELFLNPWLDVPEGNPQGLGMALAPLLKKAMQAGRVTGSLYNGRWMDIGTPERLAFANGVHCAS